MKIGEVAEQTGLSISNIRFYEKKGLIEPKRNEQSKYRDYTEENVKRLKQIILYRKMDMPLEKIACVLDGQNSLEEMVQQQLLELQHKQQEIQGSMDLCRKLVADHAYDGQNIDFYLSYVKEEEKKGHRFAELEELVCDFSEGQKSKSVFVGLVWAVDCNITVFCYRVRIGRWAYAIVGEGIGFRTSACAFVV